MAELLTNGGLETSSGDLLRWGNCDFENDGSFDSDTESYRTDVPEDAVSRRTAAQIEEKPDDTIEYHSWSGSEWELVEE